LENPRKAQTRGGTRRRGLGSKNRAQGFVCAPCWCRERRRAPRRPNLNAWLHTNCSARLAWFRRRSYLTKQPRWIERHLVAHDVVAGARQLMRECLHGEDRVALGCLLFVEALGGWQELSGKVRRLEESPGEIRIAVLDVAFTFLLFVAGPPAVD